MSQSLRYTSGNHPTEMPMRLIGLAVVLFLTLAPLAAEAQQLSKVPRIGVLGTQSLGPGDQGRVVKLPRVGLHHEYLRRAARARSG
jgi:hypothetical protein